MSSAACQYVSDAIPVDTDGVPLKDVLLGGAVFSASVPQTTAGGPESRSRYHLEADFRDALQGSLGGCSAAAAPR